MPPVPGAVIQGSFPAAARPAWVQQRIAAAPRNAPPPVQRMTPNGTAFALPPQAAGFRAQTGGQPLPPAVRQRMESVFATNFADVRIHVGPQAHVLGAHAFTQGSNIHFAPGRYDPHSANGLRLLGHELAHVVQQRAGRVRNPFGGGVAVVQDTMLEAEAERMAQRAADWRPSAKVMQRAGTLGSVSVAGARRSARIRESAAPMDLDDDEDVKPVVRTQVVGINWGALLEAKPDAGGYTIAAETDDNRGTLRAGSNRITGSITYKGVNAKGQNLGVDATVIYDMCTDYKELEARHGGAAASGGYPYFQAGADTRAVHRGHLLARCLGGKGTRINWVPLSSSANVTAMWAKVEKLAYEYLANNRAVWLEIEIRPDYAGSCGPIPSRIGYRLTYCKAAAGGGGGGGGGGGRESKTEVYVILNDVSSHSFSESVKNAWA